MAIYLVKWNLVRAEAPYSWTICSVKVMRRDWRTAHHCISCLSVHMQKLLGSDVMVSWYSKPQYLAVSDSTILHGLIMRGVAREGLEPIHILVNQCRV